MPHQRLAAALLSCCAVGLSACAGTAFDAGRTETVLPLQRAWIDGQQVHYVTTDISDRAMARMAGVNHVPRLADALRAPPGTSVLKRVYKFPQGEQISVFQSAPRPAGADNQDKSYSPLWRVVMVRWVDPKFVRPLTSEADVLAAEDRRELTLEVTGIVANCPVVRGADGGALKGVR